MAVTRCTLVSFSLLAPDANCECCAVAVPQPRGGPPRCSQNGPLCSLGVLDRWALRGEIRVRERGKEG